MKCRGYLARGEPRKTANLENTNLIMNRTSLIKSEVKKRWFDGETGRNRGSPPDGGDAAQTVCLLRRCE
jgi:hypothetical protein